LGSGMNSLVDAIAISGNGDVYAGGYFTSADGVAANSIAKWNGTEWSALGSGMSRDVFTIAISGNGDVYAGGAFTTAGGVAAKYIAKLGLALPTVGDVNNDGTIDILDVRLCLQIALGVIQGTGAQRQQADVDGDGHVTLTDAQLLSHYIIGICSTLPGSD